MKKLFGGVLGLLLMAIGLVGCVDESFTTDPSMRLSFSVDTLSFDTLFSSIPSRTAIFKVYNKHDKALNIDMIRLGGGVNSYFRFNADGRIPGDGNVLTDVIIRSNDSLYIFVEMTALESSEAMPVMVLDSMEFWSNNNRQDVKLMAYSQDAIIFRGHSLDGDTELSQERPYLVFNYLHVPANTTLRLKAGTRLFFHAGAHLIVDGNLISEGTLEEKVVLRGDRFDNMPDVLETPYDYLPSQWGNIYLQNESGHHKLNHTVIRGCDAGIFLMGANRTKPTLEIENSQIHSMGYYGIYAQNGHVKIANSEISNCGESCLVMLGGTASVTHTTIANYYSWGLRTGASVIVANYVQQSGTSLYFPIEQAVFENSIIYGSLFDELALQADTITNTAFNVLFSYCLIKSPVKSDPYFNRVTWSNASNGMGNDTVFASTRYDKESGYFNFQLVENSMARGRGNVTVAQQYPLDMNGNSRFNGGFPDLGAYEW